MATRKEVMHNLVKEEAKNLKKYANKYELELISFDKLIVDSPTRCIYGQATGECFSKRATELIKKCCTRVYENSFYMFDAKVNGSPEKLSRSNFWSPIEVFIANEVNQTNGNNKRLVDYLTGKSKKLKFV